MTTALLPRRRAAATAVFLLAAVCAVLRPVPAGATGTAAVTVRAYSELNPSAVNEKPSLVAVVTPVVPSGTKPTGTVQFMEGTTAIGAAVAVDPGGTAVYGPGQLDPPPFGSVGPHVFTAVYSGDATFAGGTSTPRTQTVDAAISRKTWIGPSGGNWSVAANWNPSGVPGSTDTVELDSNLAATSVDDVDLTVAHLSFVGGGHTVTGTGTITLPAATMGATNAGSIHAENTTGTLANKVALASGQHVVDSHIVVSGVVSGAGGIDKTGAGSLDLSGANTYTGTTDVKYDEVRALSSGALGAASGGTTVESGATLTATTANAEPLSLNGDGMSTSKGALNVDGGNVTGAVALNGAQVTVSAATNDGAVSGVVSGSSKLAKIGAPSVTLAGANTFSGGVAVQNSTLITTSATGLGSGTVALAPGTTLYDNATSPVANHLTMGVGSILSTTIAHAIVTGDIAVGNGVNFEAQNDGTELDVDGVLSGVGPIKTTGLGNVFFSGANANTYGGGSEVTRGVTDLGKTNNVVAAPFGVRVDNGAEVDVDNDDQIGDNGPVVVNGGAVYDQLGSSDTFASLASAGTVYLGLPEVNSYSRIQVQTLNLTAGELHVALNGTTPGVNQDQITVTGTAHVEGALAVQGDLPWGATAVIVNNTGSQPVSGGFGGMPEGSVVPTDTGSAILSYHGGDGNDITLTRPRARSGYWMLGADGKVYPFGDAKSYGDLSAVADQLDAPPVSLEPTPDYNGYWILTADGAVFAYGDAHYYGSPTSELDDGEVATSISSNGSHGYWVFTDEGRAFAYGDAAFFGDMSGRALNGPVLGSVGTPDALGYYMVASDGGIFSFGDAKFHGSMGGKPLNGPVVGLAPDPDNAGYWLVADDGGIFAFDAGFHGSMGGKPLNAPVVGMVAYGDGYLMVGEDGGIFDFSSKPFQGSLGGKAISAPVIGVAALNEH